MWWALGAGAGGGQRCDNTFAWFWPLRLTSPVQSTPKTYVSSAQVMPGNQICRIESVSSPLGEWLVHKNLSLPMGNALPIRKVYRGQFCQQCKVSHGPDVQERRIIGESLDTSTESFIFFSLRLWLKLSGIILTEWQMLSWENSCWESLSRESMFLVHQHWQRTELRKLLNILGSQKVELKDCLAIYLHYTHVQHSVAWLLALKNFMNCYNIHSFYELLFFEIISQSKVVKAFQ